METSTIFVIVFYFICVYIFLHTYYYLEEIDNCPCFQKDGKYAVNIDFMKFFQILEIFLITVFLSLFLLVKSKMATKESLTKAMSPMPKFILMLPLLVLIVISAFMTYNVLNLYSNIKSDCKCTDSWYRFFLYYEGIVSMISVFRFVVSIILISIVLIIAGFGVKKLKGSKK
jgi:hypothetical protein